MIRLLATGFALFAIAFVVGTALRDTRRRTTSAVATCDWCGAVLPVDLIHAPHSVDCEGGDYCGCDTRACPACCTNPKCRQAMRSEVS